jgi:hypothetical protein
MRRTVVRGKGSADSIGTRCTLQRPELASKFPKLRSKVPLIAAGAEALRTSCESKVSSSAFTSTAEKSEDAQALLEAINCPPPLAPMLTISWHCSWLLSEEQAPAAQSGAHTGAASNASTVSSASALASRAWAGIVSFILISSRYAAALQSSIHIRRPFYFTFPRSFFFL